MENENTHYISNPDKVLGMGMLSDLELYTKVMFKHQYQSSFVVAKHHREMISALQDVVDGKCKRLMINIAPRYSKTELVIKNFISWGFALNPKCRFLHLSYSDLLVKDNSETIRSIMKNSLYKSLFPASALERDKGNNQKWKTMAGGEFYAVSTQGQVTGFGAGNVDKSEEDLEDLANMGSGFDLDQETEDILRALEANTNIFQGAIIIDDPIKPEDADSEIIRERINLRFENTIRNRTNSRNTPIIIIMQRLHEHDLCGYLQEIEPDEWRVLSIPCIQTDENGKEYALWPFKHTLEELYKIREANAIVFDTQYMQDPKPREGLMYGEDYMFYTALGNKFNFSKKVDLFVDLMSSFEQLDRKGIITGMCGGMYNGHNLHNTLYNSVVAKMNYRFVPKWNFFVKGMLESAAVYKANTVLEKGNYSTSLGYLAGVEFYPMDDSNLHFFLTFVGRTYLYTDRAKDFYNSNHSTQRASVGFIYQLPMF